MYINEHHSRRAFLTRAGQLGLAGVAAPLVNTLGSIGEAAAATASDYKALVCIFLYGGNDYANTLTPYDDLSYAAYLKARPKVAIARDALSATLLRPDSALAEGRHYALAPGLAPLLPLFDQGKMAMLLNVGTLMEPTTKAQYLAKTVRLPPKLFSHNDQQSFFQASHPEGAATGWGGRIGDLVAAGNGAATLTCINASGNAVYLAGRQAVPYSISGKGPVSLLRNSKTLYGSATAASTLRQFMTSSGQTLMADDYAKTVKRSLETYEQVNAALANAPEANFALFPDNDLADQLKLVARMMSVASELGARRQVFFVSMGGYDRHNGLATKQQPMLGHLGESMKAFYETTVAMGLSDRVTSFTASDFGRTLSADSDGSDHGWGGMHWVIGGAVKGRQIIGKAPITGSNTPDDVGRGRLIPTTSVDQYAATLASWFGTSDGEMTTVLPNIGAWNKSSWNLGFL